MRWNISFPRIVPTRADIFEFVLTGNLTAVELMFSTRKATPWDTTRDGRGLLHVRRSPYHPHFELCPAEVEAVNDSRLTVTQVAARSNSLEMVRLLLGQGVDVNTKDEEGWYACLPC